MDEALEGELARAHAAQDYAACCALLVQGYGAEVLGYVAGVVVDLDAAEDVFSATVEAVWRGLPRFARRSSFRTWFYGVARHRAADHRRARARAREVLRSPSELPDVVAEARSATQSFLRTDVRDRFAAIRAELDPDDLELLVLRIDRRMAWSEIARVLHEAELDEVALARESARLRKRFQLLKDRLRDAFGR